MALTINLPEDVGTALRNKAKASGKGVLEYVESMIATQSKRPTFDEILAPIRVGFKERAESEDEILSFFDEIREEVYQEKLQVK